MRRSAERTLLDLRQPERRVIGRDDDVGVAGQPDAAAEAEPVHGGDDRHRALVDGGEGGEAAAVGTHQGREPLGRLHLLDVDAGVESLAFSGEDDHVHVRVGAGSADNVGELEPACDRQRVDRGHVDDNLGDVLGDGQADAHDRTFTPLDSAYKTASDAASDPAVTIYG